jgi:4'-phosphopantetheinyl transferase
MLKKKHHNKTECMSAGNIVHILYSRFANELPAWQFQQYLNSLPPELHADILRMRRWEDQTAKLLGKRLLIKGLQKYGYGADALRYIKYNACKRPYIDGLIDFNISHAGNYVMCAISYGVRVGVDIEEIKPVDFADFENVMTEEQWIVIKCSADPLALFYRYWVIKESVIKADGRGLHIPLKEIVIETHVARYENNWQLMPLAIDPGYDSNLATDQQAANINIEYVNV